MSSLGAKVKEQEKLIKFLASQYQKDTGRSISLPGGLGQLLGDASIVGDNKLIERENEEFDENLRKGRIAAETLMQPMTFFEAVENLKLKTEKEDPKAKKGDKKIPIINQTQVQMNMTRIDLSGFKSLRFSRAGLKELVDGISNMPQVRSLNLRHNGIGDEHEKEVLSIFNIKTVKNLDLSCNNIAKLALAIGRKMRDEATHFAWFDITQNDFLHDVKANTDILAGLKRQKCLTYAGLSVEGALTEQLVRLVPPKRAASISLNMRNSTFTPLAIYNLSQCLSNSNYYITALSFKFTYLGFDELLMLADGIKFNKTLVKLDLSHNCFKACVMKYLFEALVDNSSVADLNLSSNFLDNEFAVDLAHLLESNQQFRVVDISNNPIGPEGAKYLLESILAHNDTLESLGDIKNTNVYMGVRLCEEITQALMLNMNSHEKKRAIMNQIKQTKANNAQEKDIPQLVDPNGRKTVKFTDDKTLTMEQQLKYPLLKPISFSNPIDDDYLNSGVWHIKS